MAIDHHRRRSRRRPGGSDSSCCCKLRTGQATASRHRALVHRLFVTILNILVSIATTTTLFSPRQQAAGGVQAAFVRPAPPPLFMNRNSIVITSPWRVLKASPLYAAASNKRNNKSKQQKSKTASSERGFGAKPLSLEEVVAQFPTRLPKNALELPCPCRLDSQRNQQGKQQPLESSSLIQYQDCCAPYHAGDKSSESPERVLRSRYSAFCYRLIPYILQTTHPDCSDYQENKIKWAKELNKQGMFDDFNFVALEIFGDTTYSGGNNSIGETTKSLNELAAEEEEAFLKFKVRLAKRSPVLAATPNPNGKRDEVVVTENSRFLKADDTQGWLYVSGDVETT
ncbi:hypothetical protein ACA910_003847 [Epithemia clementina (nom. ined.)]